MTSQPQTLHLKSLPRHRRPIAGATLAVRSRLAIGGALAARSRLAIWSRLAGSRLAIGGALAARSCLAIWSRVAGSRLLRLRRGIAVTFAPARVRVGRGGWLGAGARQHPILGDPSQGLVPDLGQSPADHVCRVKGDLARH